MKRPLLIAASLLVPFTAARAEEPPLRELLRDGLYAEEVSRDPEAAARQYEQVLSRFGEQRNFAAASLFRLAEVRRKQDRKEDAVKLYQQLLAEFPGAANETKLARQNLAALGGQVPSPGGLVLDDEARELARIQELAKTSPDVLLEPKILSKAVSQGFQEVVAYLLSAGANPFAGGTLTTAASHGNLAITKQLLATGVTVPEDRGWEAIAVAVSDNRFAVLEFLLKAGIKPGPDVLYFALLGEDRTGAELLLNHGADPNSVLTDSTPADLNRITVLQKLIGMGKFASANWLLDKGAKPDLADDRYGVSPLHYATQSGQEGCLEMMERLLGAGADVNRTSSPSSQSNNDPRPAPLRGVSPLAIAAKSTFKSTEKVVLLLKHGANPNVIGEKDPLVAEVLLAANQEVAKLLIDAGAELKQPRLLRPFLSVNSENNLAQLRFLLENGADPNIPDGKLKIDQTEYFSNDPFLDVTAKVETYPYPPIYRIRFSKDENPGIALEMTRLMLAAGATAGPVVGMMLEQVAGIDEKGDVFRALLAQRPANLILKGYPDLSNWKSLPRRIYLEEVLIPALAKQPDITLLDSDTGIRKPFYEVGTNKVIPPTLELFRSQQDVLLGPENSRQWPNLALVRIETDGAFKRSPIDLAAETPLPELRGGDILEIHKEGMIARGRSAESQEIYSRYQWHLDKRVSFPITVAIDGKVREIRMRGDLLVFDPTTNEFPLVSAGTLVSLLLPDVFEVPEFIVVKRSGWNDIRLPLKGNGAAGFKMQGGDQLVLERSKTSKLPEGFERVMLVSPGVPFTKSFFTQSSETEPGRDLLPTLVQVITDAYSPNLGWIQSARASNNATSVDVPRENEALFPWLHETQRSSGGQGGFPVILSAPDFSKIRIHRTDKDGKVSMIAVDLAESIRSCSDATMPEDARKGDVSLHPGDIVELPVLEHPDGLWAGFSVAEVRFFRKVLSGRIVLNRGTGQVEQRDLQYSPPEWRVTSHGILPVPPLEGISTTRLGALITWGGDSRLTRAGRDPIVVSSETFLRDGDQIDAMQRTRAPRSVVTPSN